MAAVLTRTGVDFFRESKPVGQTLLDRLGQPNDLDGYLTGTKVQPLTFSDDLSRLYVGGKGSIYVIDTLTFKQIDTITVPAGRNITSLVCCGNRLIIGEGSNYGVGAGNYRILILDINPQSVNYHNPQTITVMRAPEVANSPLGVSDMALGPDGRTLVVSVPNNPNSLNLGDPEKRGNVWVFDFDSLNIGTGQIDTPIPATLSRDGISGKSPQIITATQNPDHFLISNVADFERGLSTLVLIRDSVDKVSRAELTAISMSQPTQKIVIDRLDIQRAQSAVLVEQDGVEYAIVADDNYNFLDPYWRAMFEAPTFLGMPNGLPPLSSGGSASAKKVAVGAARVKIVVALFMRPSV